MLHGLKIIIGIFFISIKIYSQPLVYSRNYFRWPVSIKPGIVANFGELRSGHWHMGLDIRTDQKENMPVYAAADGYIAKISVRPFSYGQAIYINHPNGLTTVYGHLNKFFPRLDSLVKAEQYKRQSWEIELDFTKDKFPVRKGQFIAYSGSTGASQGPHVHFEIRNTETERCINPFFFNLPIPDATPPVFAKLAIYNKNMSVYDQNPILLAIKKNKNRYFLEDSLIKTGFSKLSFAIGAYDCVSGSTNPNGIYSAKIFLDERPLIQFVLDSMDYNETDYVNAHIDYRYRYNSGSYLQQLFKLPGDKGSAYQSKNGDGTIFLNDTNVHSVKIQIGDVKQNTSVLNFNVQYNDSLASLMNYIPHKSFPPNYVNVFEQNDFEVYLPENCLYDSIQPVFYRISQSSANAVSLLFQFSNASVPVHDRINVRLKPNVAIPEELNNKIVIKRTDSKSISYRKAEWQKDWLAANFDDFGSYQAFIDTVSPTINNPASYREGKADTTDLSPSENIAFYPRDNSGIKNFRAELDGQWLMFSNDKGSVWIYKFDERCPYGVHQLRIKIADIVGNITEKEWWFKRYPYTSPGKKTSHKKVKNKNRIPNKKKVSSKKK
jgi:murein DD-endopeptidase MepM/ murein hydrolase activator NlpD